MKSIEMAVFTAVFIIQNDQLLLVKHVKPDETFYTLPGGKIEPGELCSEAAIREVLEETGLEIDKSKLLFAHTLNRKIDAQNSSLVIFFHTTDWLNSPFNKEPEKHAEVSWHPLSNLPSLMRPHHRQALNLWKKNSGYSEWGHAEPAIVAKEALSAFLNQSVDAISCEPLAGGSEEARVLKCTHSATNYVVKLFSNNEFGNNEIGWTQLASDLGIGPKFYYANPTGSFMIIEFAKGNSLVPPTANAPAILKSTATSLERLHSSTAPFAHTSDMFTRIDTKYKKLECSGKLKDILICGLEQVQKIQGQLQSLTIAPVPCHNDLNPGNIFAHNNQVILIDWGDAALGNPYYDIAAFFVLNLVNPQGETLFFEHYAPKLLYPQWQRDMQLYKQLVHFEFALNLLLGVQAGKSELLHAHAIQKANNISYYLTLLAEQKTEIDSSFLYNMAIASLGKMLGTI